MLFQSAGTLDPHAHRATHQSQGGFRWGGDALDGSLVLIMRALNTYLWLLWT